MEVKNVADPGTFYPPTDYVPPQNVVPQPAQSQPPLPGFVPYPGNVQENSAGPAVQQPAVVSSGHVASAPPLEKMNTVPGYESITFEDAPLPPPSYDDTIRTAQNAGPDLSRVPQMTCEEAKEALEEFVNSNCCYGKGAARQLEITNIEGSSAFHYTLETFTERRETSWATEPYQGGYIDSPANGPAPQPWQVPVTPTSTFQNEKKVVEVPHTASVRTCHACAGVMRIRCTSCFGQGGNSCTWCSGVGSKSTQTFDVSENRHIQTRETCSSCNGTGRQRCFKCSGHGQVTCSTCDGHGQLKYYVRLSVKWENHSEDHVSDKTGLPPELFRNVNGELVVDEVQQRVWPLSAFPERNISQASEQLVQKHATGFPSEYILSQRQRVKIIPVFQVHYKYKDRTGKYFVYDFSNTVYFPDYPHNCCWCCSIL